MALVQAVVPLPPPPSHLETPSSATSTANSSFGTKTPSTSRTVTPKGHQRQMSFQMSSFGAAQQNPYPVPPVGYTHAAGNHTPQPPQIAGVNVSEIYTAVYSGISVYEMMVNGINVMRRRHDSWLNATQILKVAGVEKGKRTKVLEKEILSGKHEKVQGGYGKYQGTWIEYERGCDFCRQYGVEELLRPLLEYDMGQDGEAGKGAMDTPTKEQAMAAQRKKMMYQGTDSRAAQSPNGTFFKNISASAANAVQAINRARFDSPGSRPGSAQKPRPSLARSQSSGQKYSQDSLQQSSQQSFHSFQSDGSFGVNGNLDPSLGNAPNPYLSQGKRLASGLGGQEPPRKRLRPTSSQETLVPTSVDRSMNLTPTDVAGPTASFSQRASDSTSGVPPLAQPTSSFAKKKQQTLMSLIMADEHADSPSDSTFNQLSGQDFDIPMDDKAHTALIWAATLARLPLVKKLAANGANIRRVNVGGETALMRAASATNNFSLQTFPELLEILGPTIEVRDGRGRTVLHHISIASAIEGRSDACKYYLECLLAFVVGQGSNAPSSQISFTDNDAPSSSQQKQKGIGIVRFMFDIVNAQDVSGDTALNMAARNGNKALAKQLLEVGANPSIANNGGLKPTDFGVDEIGAATRSGRTSSFSQSQQDATQTGTMGPPAKKMGNKVTETGVEVLDSMTAIIEDAKSSYLAESRAKQTLIDDARTKLQYTRERLQAEKARLIDLRGRRDARRDLQAQIMNLRRTNEEKASEIILSTQQQPKTNVKLGDADAGLWIDKNLLPDLKKVEEPLMNGTAEVNGDAMDVDHARDEQHAQQLVEPPVGELSPEQYRWASTVLTLRVYLEARRDAYKANNDLLTAETERLKQKSGALEQKLKRILGLLQGKPMKQVEGMLSGLATAIDSEGGEWDMDRLRRFMRKMEGTNDGEETHDDGEETEVEEE